MEINSEGKVLLFLGVKNSLFAAFIEASFHNETGLKSNFGKLENCL